MKQVSVMEAKSENVWKQVEELQKNPEFVRAVREFIRQTTS